MKKFKDFLYNWNDIIVILCILIAAVAIIYWRMNIIMEYPKVMAMEVQNAIQAQNEAENALTPQTPASSSTESSSTSTTETSNATAGSSSGATAGSSESSSGTSTSSTSETPEPGSGPKNGRLWSGGMLREEVTVTTQSGSAADAAEALVQAGLFTSYEDFAAVCELNGYDPTDIKANTFTFAPGTTQSQIAEEVTKPMS